MVAHRVNHAQVEFEVPTLELAHALTERISQLHAHRIAPLLDRVCSELSGPERIDRIDQLELELGSVSADDFDEQFMQQLELALRASLSKALRERSGPSAHVEAAFELVETFAWTCNLPWWADASASNPVATSLACLVREAPERLTALLRELAVEPLALARVSAQLDERLEVPVELAGQAELVASALRERERSEVSARSIAAAIERVESFARTGSDSPPSNPIDAELELLTRAAVGELLELLRELAKQPSALARVIPHLEGSPQGLALLAELGGSRMREDADASTKEQPSSGRADVDSQLVDSQLIDSQAADPRTDPQTIDPPAPRPTTPHLAEPPTTDPPPASASAPRPRDPTLPARSETVERPTTPAIARPAHGQAQAARARVLDRLDELYVEDGGLVLLWPFLARFFARVELIDDQRRFVDEHARMQAIHLLEHLAFEQLDPPEYTLPLVKLLCGLAPTDDLLPSRPLTPALLAEGEHLLAAAIDNAPILRAMAVPRFRVGFLQRPAALTIHEGTWLLRVERRTHDIVLERFPWSWAWVKLPWMPDALRVEW